MGFFSYDSKFGQLLDKFFNSCYLNLLWLVCSLPLFTVGASTTALYYVTLKIARGGEETSVTRMFFRSFRENFRQSTVLWLILLVVGLLLAGDGFVLFRLRAASAGAVAVFWTLLLAVLIVLLIAVSIRVPGYIPRSYMNVLTNGSVNMVLSCGMLCVLLVGSIDISITAVLAFSGAVIGKLMGIGALQSTLLAFLIPIALGVAVGVVNGVLMSYGRVIPIIVTLSTSYIVRALIPMNWLLGMNKVAPTDLTQGFKDSLNNHFFLSIPYLTWLAVLVVVIIGVFLKYTRTGRNLYAVGSNAEAAQMRGVHINRIKILAHMICGATAGLAGAMWLARYAAIEKGAANGDEMFTIAACVLGGVSVTGGYGKITGVVIGAVMIAVIDSAIPQLGIGNSMITEFIKGILLLFAILLNVILQRIADRQALAGRNI